MFKRKTHKDFVEELLNKNPNIKVLGEYINARTKIEVQCLMDNHIWYATPDNLLRGYGCPKCAGKCKTTKSFIEDLHFISPHIEVLGKYKTNNTKIKCCCKKHEYIWYPTPSHLLQGQGCIYVSAKYCYAAHESRLHQNDRCKRFALCLVLTVRFRSLAPWGKLFQLFI